MIHETAVVSRDAKVGKNVAIGPFSVIEAGTEIGDDCVVGPHVYIRRFTTLGAGCQLHAGAVIGDDPQDLAFSPGTESYVKIGAGCVLREGVTIHRGTKPGTTTEVGDHCFLMANSHLAHNVRLGHHVVMANGALVAGYVEVGERVFISGNVAIHQFVRIGRLAMLGGGCGASKDVPPFCLLTPIKLNEVAGLNVVGLKRNGFTPEQRLEIKRIFKLLYASGLNVKQAVSRMATEFPSELGTEIRTFIEASQRGICPSKFSRSKEA